MNRLEHLLSGPLAPAEQPGPGLDLEVFANLSVQLGRVADEMEAQRRRQQRFQTALHLIEVALPPITTSSFTLSIADLMGPVTGKVWDVRSITAANFTGGTVSVYKGQVAPQNLKYVLLQAGTQEVGSGGFFLQGNDTMVLVSNSAFTGTAMCAFSAVEFDDWLLPDYLL